MSKKRTPEIGFQIHSIYAQYISFEVPHALKIFQKEWKKEIKLYLYIAYHNITENIYEFTLHIIVKAKIGKYTAFLC